MKAPTLVQVGLSMLLLVLAIGRSQQQGPQAASANALTAPAGWLIQTIDSTNDIGQYASLAARGGNLFLSYYDSSKKDLRYAIPSSSGGNCGPNNRWHCETLDSTDDVGKNSSIAVPGGTGSMLFGPAIAYDDVTNGNLKYADYHCLPQPCGWRFATIDAMWDQGMTTSIKYDSTGAPRIAYVGNPDISKPIRYAHSVSSGGNCGAGDAAGKWDCETVGFQNVIGQYPSLDLDAADLPYLSYYDYSAKVLRLAKRVNSGGNCGGGGSYAKWQCDTVDNNADVGRYNSIAVRPGTLGNTLELAIAYFDNTNKTLKLYNYDCTPNACSSLISTIAISNIADNGMYPSIKYDESGILHISYQVVSFAGPTYYVWHAYQVSSGGNCGTGAVAGRWQCEMIDLGANLGQYTSMVIAGKRPYIAYYDSALGDLKLAFLQAQVFFPSLLR